MMQLFPLVLLLLSPPMFQGTQEPRASEIKRGQVRCTVTLPSGKPWAKATVLLLSRPVATHAEIQGADLVRVVTDERGVARAKIWPGQPYSCWAQGAIGGADLDESIAASRQYRCSRVLEDIRAGDIMRLQARDQLQTQHEIQIQGLERWKAHAPFLVRVASTGPVRIFHQRVALDDGGCFRIPQMPGPGAFIQIFGKGMYPIFHEPVPLDAEGWRLARTYRRSLEKKHGLEELDPGSVSDRYVVKIPPPAWALVDVKDPNGNALAGAVLSFDPNQARSPWYEVGRTNKEGRGKFEIPAYRRKDGTAYAKHLDVLVQHKGVADSWAVREGVAFAADGSMTPLAIDCAVGHTGRGSLHLREGQAAADQELILFSSVQRGKNGGQVGIGPYRFRTKSDGSFELPGRAGNYHYRVCTWLTPTQIAALGFDRTFPTAPLVVLASQKGTEQAPIQLQLDQFVPVELQMLGRDGSPDENVRLYVGEVKGGGQAPHYPQSYRPNRRGRLRILCRPDHSLLVFAVGTRGARIEQIDVAAGAPPQAIRRKISLDQGLLIGGQVLDARGKTVGNAMLTLKSINAGLLTNRFGILSNWTTMAMLASSTSSGARTGRAENPNRIWRARQWRYYSHPSSQVQSDSTGKFELWLPEGYLHASITATQAVEGTWMVSKSTACQLTDGSAIDLRLVIEDQK
jgi:hypothetical protein